MPTLRTVCFLFLLAVRVDAQACVSQAPVSLRPKDLAVASCMAWCKEALAKNQCAWCKCKACAFCNATAGLQPGTKKGRKKKAPDGVAALGPPPEGACDQTFSPRLAKETQRARERARSTAAAVVQGNLTFLRGPGLDLSLIHI